MALMIAGVWTLSEAAPAPADPQLEGSRRFTRAALQEAPMSTGHGDPRETAVLYAAEAARLARGDERQRKTALGALRTALTRLSGTPLRIHERLAVPESPRLRSYEGAAISSITLNQDGSLIAVGTHEGLVYVWRAGNDGAATLVKLLTAAPQHSPQLAFAEVERVQFLFHGRWLLVTSTGESGKVMRAIAVEAGFADVPVPPEWQRSRALIASPDGGTVAVLSADGSAVALWREEDGRPRTPWLYSDPARPIRAVFFSATGRQVLAVHDASAVTVLDADTGQRTRLLVLPPVPRSAGVRPRVIHSSEPGFDADISPDGRVLILQETRTIDIEIAGPIPDFETPQTRSLEVVASAWDIAKDPPVILPNYIPDRESQFTQFRFSRNGWLGVAGGLRLSLRDVTAKERPVYTFTQPRKVVDYHTFTGLSFDRGARVVVGTAKGTVELRTLADAASMDHPVILPGLIDAVPEMAHEGGRMAVWSKLWFADEVNNLHFTFGHGVRVCDLDRDCRPEGAAPAAESDLADLLARAWRVVRRNMTLAEWRAVQPGAPYQKTFDDLPEDVSVTRSQLEQADGEAAAGHADEARQGMQRTLDAASASGNPFALEQVARVAIRRSMPDVAERAAGALLQVLQDDPRALRYRGWARALQGERAAMQDLQRYIDWVRAGRSGAESAQESAQDQDAIRLLLKGQKPKPPMEWD
jgi:hypothetical protein